MPFGRLGKFARFPFQLLDGLARVAVEPAFALHVLGHLVDAAGQGFDGFRGAAFLFCQRVPLERHALHNRRCYSRLLAQGGQGGICSFARLGGFARGRLRLCRLGGAFAQLRVCLGAGDVCVFPTAVQQQTFGMAQFFADGAIPRRLTGLSRQLCKLRRKLLDHVIDTQQVRFGVLELQFRLVPTLVEAGNPCCFLKNAAAVLWLGVDQLADLALPHERGGMRPG